MDPRPAPGTPTSTAGACAWAQQQESQVQPAGFDLCFPHYSERALRRGLFLLCPRYPSDLQRFSRSRLPGPWDPSRAGKRMKLLRPETWEREVSLRGNRAAVWEELIGEWPRPHSPLLTSPLTPLCLGPGRNFCGPIWSRSCLLGLD